MRVIVTGGTGFLGRHIVWRLAANGDSVLFTGRNKEAAREVINSARRPVEFHPIDFGTIGSATAFLDCVRGCDAIVNAAALSSPWGPAKEFYRCNVSSTKEVVDAANAHGIGRLVHISSPTIYCERRDRENIRENDSIPRPMNAYSLTKWKAELLLRKASTVETAILRPRAIYGPWDTVLLPRLLRAAKQREIPLIRGGAALLDITYVDNVVDAVMLALSRPLTARVREFNVSNGEPISFRHLIDSISDHFEISIPTASAKFPVVDGAARLLEWAARMTFGPEPALTRYGAAVISFSQTLSLDRIHEELGFTPRIGNDEGLKRHSAWYRATVKSAERKGRQAAEPMRRAAGR